MKSQWGLRKLEFQQHNWIFRPTKLWGKFDFEAEIWDILEDVPQSSLLMRRVIINPKKIGGAHLQTHPCKEFGC